VTQVKKSRFVFYPGPTFFGPASILASLRSTNYLYSIRFVILCGDCDGIGRADEAGDGAHSRPEHELAGGTGHGSGAFQSVCRMDCLVCSPPRRCDGYFVRTSRLLLFFNPHVSAAIIRFSLPSAAFWLFWFLLADLFGSLSFGGGFGSTSVTGHARYSTTSASGHVNDPAMPGGSSIYDRSRDRDHTEWHWPSSAEMHGLHREPRQSMMDAVRMAVFGGRGCCGRGRGSGIFWPGHVSGPLPWSRHGTGPLPRIYSQGTQKLDGLCPGHGMALALCLGTGYSGSLE
jgi:hypothetical protein